MMPVLGGDVSEIYYRIMVVAKKDRSYKNLDDLEGKTFAYTALGDNNLEFLNKIIFNQKIEVERHFSKLLQVTTPSSAVMSVIYDQADCAGVSAGRYETLKELNPMFNRTLMTVYTSPDIPASPMCYLKDNISPEIRKKLEKIFLTMHESVLGQQTLMPFRVERFLPIKYEALKAMETALASAKTLPQKPGKEVKPVRVTKVTTETPKSVFTFKKISHTYQPQNESVLVKAQISSREKITKTELIFQMKGQEKTTVPMKEVKAGYIQTEIKLPPKAAMEGEKEVVYKVKPGDTLGVISKKFYGEKKKWIMIATYNRLANPNLIFVDQKLRIKVSGKFENVVFDVWVKATLQNEQINVSPKKTILITR